jgi:hypothetical protein
MSVEIGKLRRQYRGRFHCLQNRSVRPDDVDNGQERVGQWLSSFRNSHAIISNVLVVYGGWQSNAAVCIVNEERMAHLGGHDPVEDINSPPGPAAHFTFDYGPCFRV